MDSPDKLSLQPVHPRRPTHLDRVFDNVSPVYFVTLNTHNRARILARNEIHHVLVDFCQRAQDFRVAVGRYVLMPDHLHLFVAMPEMGDITLSKWVQSLKAVLGKQLLKLGTHKPHWQEGYFDHLLRNERSHAQKWDYVHMNPVRAGLCREPEDWPYQGEVVIL